MRCEVGSITVEEVSRVLARFESGSEIVEMAGCSSDSRSGRLLIAERANAASILALDESELVRKKSTTAQKRNSLQMFGISLSMPH